MKFRSRILLNLLAGVGLLTVARPVTATSFKIDAVSQLYNVRAEYNGKLAIPGNTNLELKITMTNHKELPVPASDRLSLAGCQSFDEPRIKIEKLHEENKVEDVLNFTEYFFRVEIPKEMEARTYRIKLLFKYESAPKKLPVERYFPLNVGTLRPGKLKFIPEEEESEPLELGIRSNTQGSFGFKLVNEYPDYTVNINRIAVGSSPSWLIGEIKAVESMNAVYGIQGKEILFDPPLSMLPSQEQFIKLMYVPGGTPRTKWITGFSDKDTKLIFNIQYDDSNERPISSFNPSAKIKVKPTDAILLGAMLIGVIVGTGIKFYLEYLHKSGIITRRGVATFVLITVVVGVVITVIAWAGEIQIIAFKNIELSYDKPVVIGLIGLIGALVGVHYLHGWAKSYLQVPGGGND